MDALEAYAESEFADKPIYAGLISGAKFTLTPDSTIEAKFESKLQIDMFQDIKSEVLQYLRDKLGDRQLAIYEVATGNGDDSDATRPKLYTDEDKLKFLAQKNPLLLNFKQKFNLDFK